MDRRPHDERSGNEHHATLDGSRHVLGLAVAELMHFVRRLRRETQRPQPDKGGDQVDAGLQSIGHQAN